MIRVLATPESVQKLFKACTAPYAYVDNEGNSRQIEIPAWECRGCGWVSLKGVKDLPFPHECSAAPAVHGVAGTITKF